MKTAISMPPPPSPSLVQSRPIREAFTNAIFGRRTAYIALTKPRIVNMVLITVAVGFLLGARGAWNPAILLLTLIGTGLVAAGASVWNQYLEREIDRRMRRTASRPLPSGQLEPGHAALFGTALTLLGLGLLAMGPHPIAAAVALVTFLLYAFVYTPLKSRTTLNTAVGAIPGALPPVIGWSAATGQLGIESLALFLIVFLWQFPHFLAIAWIYRSDYERAGLRMLPGIDPSGTLTGRQSAAHALALIPVGLLPAVVGLAGPIYFLGALGLGIFYLDASLRFWRNVSDTSARRLLRASILYLPAILLLLLLNPLPS
ncbi:heme o synthase [soil metagenome]